MNTYWYEDIKQIFQGWQLWNELLYHFTEGFKYWMVIDTGQIKAEMRREGKERKKKI